MRQSVGGGEDENVNEWMADVEREGADGCEINGNKVLKLIQMQR